MPGKGYFRALSRLRANTRSEPKDTIATPRSSAQRPTFEDGAVPPVSGISGSGSGVAVGIAAGAPSLPTARLAGMPLRLPHTLVPPLLRRTEADRIVSEPSALMATIARSEMLVLSSSGAGDRP